MISLSVGLAILATSYFGEDGDFSTGGLIAAGVGLSLMLWAWLEVRLTGAPWIPPLPQGPTLPDLHVGRDTFRLLPQLLRTHNVALQTERAALQYGCGQLCCSHLIPFSLLFTVPPFLDCSTSLICTHLQCFSCESDFSINNVLHFSIESSRIKVSF